ncbi:MAG: hypothetical protein WBA76_13790 [Phormidesmis sp.]
MLSKVPSVFKFALPVTLLASPLLLAAAQPVDLETYGIYCNDPSTSAPQLNLSAANASDRSAQSPSEAQSNPASPTSTKASVRSQRQASFFSGDRWPAALRLLRSNPYADSPRVSHSRPATEPPQSNCLAVKNEPFSVQIAQAAGELPDLSGSPIPAPIAEPPAVTPSVITPPVITPSVITPPAVEPPAKPPVVESPAALPSLPASEPSLAQPTAPVSPPPTAASPLPENLPSLGQPSSLDPNNFTPTTLNPTLFDGKPIETLAALRDGNYRYLAGEAEDRIYTDDELRARGGSVFVFKKEGNLVTGNLLPSIGQPGICVTGVTSGDRVSGEAYPLGDADALPNISALQMSQTARTGGAAPYYAGATLDLSGFSMINAGASLPPASCKAGRTGG